MFIFGKRLLKIVFGALLLSIVFIVGVFIFCFSNLKMIAGGILILTYVFGLLPLAALFAGVGLFALVGLNLVLGLPVIMHNGEWILN